MVFYNFLAWVSVLITGLISASGYLGIFFLMVLESASLPVPSEIIMPFSGFLVFEGKFSFWSVVTAGILGNLIGSQIAYIFGYYGGRPLIKKYGKYFLVSDKELKLADDFFKKYGNSAVFMSRLLPVIRTFISLPAGIARMDFKKFSFYTIIGSFPWNFVLTYAGLLMGESWKDLEIFFQKIDWLIGILVIVGAGYFIYSKLKTGAPST